MTRGRRKDTTLPTSHALMIQRAYRDRRAKYLAELEERCRKTEKENERLRKELELVRSESGVGSINVELVPACSDLMQTLERTQNVLSLFQQQQRALGARPPESSESERVVPSATELDIAAILGHSLRQDPTGQTIQQPSFEKNTFQSSEPPLNATADNNDGSGCCSGIFDCSALTE